MGRLPNDRWPGLSLVETLMGLILLSLITAFMLGLFGQGFRVSQSSRHLSTALFLAQEKMEDLQTQSLHEMAASLTGQFSGRFAPYRYSIGVSNYSAEIPSLKLLSVEVSGPRGEKVHLVTLVTAHLTGLSAGANHSLVLKDDGTVWAWGSDSYGQLGNNLSGISSASSSPVEVCASPGTAAGACSSYLVAAKAISGGSSHSLILKENGAVWACGSNRDGQLGNGTFEDHRVPFPVSNCAGCSGSSLLGGIAAVSGSITDDFSLALRKDGTVLSWGYNSYGQLGNNLNGEATNSRVPVPVCASPGVEAASCAKLLTDITAIAAGYNHSLALKKDGTVWTWGNNTYGQLGNNNAATNLFSAAPVQVCATASPLGGCRTDLDHVAAIAAGFSHSAALKSDGTVWAWGNNFFGQLGQKTTETFSALPVQVCAAPGEKPGSCIAPLRNVVALAAGGYHTLALKSDGTIRAWGHDGFGQLGNNRSGSDKFAVFPVQVCADPGSNPGSCANFLSSVVSIAAGDYYSLALKSDGTIWGWGNNSYGQIGNGKTAPHQDTPAQTLRF